MTERMTTGPVPIAYRVDGPQDGPAILMINGLGMQLIQWPAGFLRQLHDAGFRTVRVDNRDVGRSGRISGAKAPNPYLQLVITTLGLPGGAPYSLSHMADDARSVLDDLGLEKAHVLGLSMGGIIAQLFAADHRDRTDRVALFMTTSGNRSLPRPKGEAARILFGREAPPRSAEEAVDRMVEKWQFFMTNPGGMSTDDLRAFHRAAVDRGMDLEGWQRQFAAIIESGDIRAKSRTIKAPTLIIHGRDDRLVPLAAGQDVHASIPGSRMEIIDGMGHDIPPVFEDRLATLVSSHFGAD